MTTPGSSRLWQSLSDTTFAKVDDEFVSSFRKPGGANSRLGSWDPFDKTMRYFKFMLFAAAERESDAFFGHYRNLGQVDVGAPVAVRMRGCSINIDYLMAVQEYMFLASSMNIASIRSVVEIGAGFGRTCQAMLALSNTIERYTIVDLPQVLDLSRRVLALTVPAKLEKIEFIDARDVTAWSGIKRDLAINIDSFQEMPPATIERYMTDVVAGCAFLYVKNPVAKYDPKAIGIETVRQADLQDVFALGYCRDVVDIFDDAELAIARRNYLEAYRPSSAWTVAAERSAELFPYFHHVLYRKG